MTLPQGWQYGVDPGAVGLRGRALGRIALPAGEALRLEMESGDPGAGGAVHVQYYIDTDAGGWALWLVCRPDELARCEAAVEAIGPEPADES